MDSHLLGTMLAWSPAVAAALAVAYRLHQMMSKVVIALDHLEKAVATLNRHEKRILRLEVRNHLEPLNGDILNLEMPEE